RWASRPARARRGRGFPRVRRRAKRGAAATRSGGSWWARAIPDTGNRRPERKNNLQLCWFGFRASAPRFPGLGGRPRDLLPRGVERLGQDARLAEYGHEVVVAVPARHDVRVEVG